MKRLSVLILLGILSVGCCVPALANAGPRVQSRADRKADKKQQKAQRRYEKAQRKAQRRMIKKDRKNTKIYPARHY